MLRIDSCDVVPAEIDSTNQTAFQGQEFTLKKSRWISDESAIFCAVCRSKFNQLRRKHHCRCCGQVLCNKCCTEKVPLPQYGLDSPERVCRACVPVATCVTMSYSNDPAFHLRAVTGLSDLCRDSPASVISLGGAHMLIYLTKKKSPNHIQTLVHIANSLHSLVRHSSLVTWLAGIGAIEAIGKLLELCNLAIPGQAVPVITDTLSALRLFLKANDNLKIAAVQSGCLPSLLVLCNHTEPSVSLVATTTLCLLAECQANQAVIINEQNALRSMLYKVVQSPDEQVTEHVLRVIVVLSAGTENTKHVISSEDATCGGVIAQALQSKHNNMQINANAASAIANLATSERDQVLLQSSLRAVLSQLKAGQPDYVSVQLIRAAANFSAHPAHAALLLQHINPLTEYLTKCGSNSNAHAVRCIFNLLRHRKSETVASLCRNGVSDFLQRFTELDDVMVQILDSLNRAAPPVIS